MRQVALVNQWTNKKHWTLTDSASEAVQEDTPALTGCDGTGDSPAAPAFLCRQDYTAMVNPSDDVGHAPSEVWPTHDDGSLFSWPRHRIGSATGTAHCPKT